MLEEDRQRCGHPNTPSPNPSTITITTTTATATLPPCIHIPFSTSPSSPVASDLPTRLLTSDILTADMAWALEGLLTTRQTPSSASLNERMSHFTELPPSRRPSIFDSDPCSRTCTHSQHAYRKASLYSRLGRVRRTTLPDLTSHINLLSSDPSHRHRRFSMSTPVPLCMDSPARKSSTSHKPVMLSGHSEEDLCTPLSTACGYGVVLVVSIWLLPYIVAILSLILWDVPAGPSPF